MTITTPQTTVPLNKLTLWKGNVRKTGAETGLDELASSIQAHGLINPLTVRPAVKGKYAVIAGQRRLLALHRLAETGSIEKNAPIACSVAADGSDRAELSLAENVVRIAMHPADQFDAWAALIDKGASPAIIADRFGVQESLVRKRLALARVSPRMFALYRAGSIDLEMLQAFTITDDHALQESIWENAPDWQRRDARSIRRALTESDIPTSDRRVQFIGLAAYEEAGGAVRRDLFDPQGGGFVQDAALLEKLTRDKLDGLAAEMQAEGWKWTEGRTEFSYEDRREFECGEIDMVELSPEIEEEAARLEDERRDLTEGDEIADPDRFRQIETRLTKIDAMRYVWPDSLKANAGAVVYLTYGGAVESERGLIRPEDARQPADDDKEAEVESEIEPAAPALPASLIEELTAQKTAALRIETARSPKIALAMTVHALATGVFYHYGDCALKARVATRSLRTSIAEHESCAAIMALNDERDRIGDILPGQQSDLWDWCLKSDRAALLNVLAVAVAHGIDAVASKADQNAGGRWHGEALAQALKLDMCSWYRPTAKGYFSRIGKARILADLEAARGAPGAPAWAKLKKAELADLAERETAERGWLPAPLR